MPDNEIPDTAGDHYHLCYLHLRKLKKNGNLFRKLWGEGLPSKSAPIIWDKEDHFRAF